MSAAVVKLPTAAPRKVRNPLTRAARKAREGLPQFPRNRPVWPEQRKSYNAARLILDMERTPELAIATAIFHALDPLVKLKVQAFVAMLSLKDGRPAVQASAWLDVIGGETQGVSYAIDRIQNGEWE